MLCLGSYFRALIKFRCNSKIYNKDIVGRILKIFDSQFDEDDNPMISNLVIGKKNPSSYIMSNVKNVGNDVSYIIENFENSIIDILMPGKMDDLVKLISMIILEDNDISDDAEVEVISHIKKCELSGYAEDYAVFLAGIFLFTIKNTENTGHSNIKGYIDELANMIDTYDFPNGKNMLNVECAKKEKNIDYSKIKFFRNEGCSSIATATILGKWEENNSSDIKLIESFVGSDYNVFLEDIKCELGDIIKYQNGFCCVENIMELREELIKGINESFIDGVFNVFIENINSYSEFFRLSDVCFYGVFDFIAYFGNNISKCSRISSRIWSGLVYSFENRIFKNNNKFQTNILIEYSNLLIEANINSFVSNIEDRLECNESNLIKLLEEKNNKKISILLADTLSKGASQKNSFSKIIYIMFLCRKYNKCFAEKIANILVPKFFQTSASNEQLLGIIKKMYKEDKEYTWELIYNILIRNITSRFDIINLKYLPRLDCVSKKEDMEIKMKNYLSFLCKDSDLSEKKIIALIKILRIYFEIGIFNQYNSINVNQNGIVIENIIKKYDRMALSCEKEGYIYLAEVYRNVVKKYQYFFEEV